MLKKIMDEIKAGLTGEAEIDVAYLGEQMEKYEEHELSEKIKMECGAMLVNLLLKDGPPGLVIAGELEPSELMAEANFGFDEKYPVEGCGCGPDCGCGDGEADIESEHVCGSDCGCGDLDFADEDEAEHVCGPDCGCGDGEADSEAEHVCGPDCGCGDLDFADEDEDERVMSPYCSSDVFDFGDDDDDEEDYDPEDYYVPGDAPYGPLEDTLNEYREYIISLISDKKLEEATDALRKVIEKLEERGMVKEDNEHIYMSFNEWFEDVLYNFHFKPKKTTELAPANYSNIYTEYANLLYAVERYDEAEKALEKAMIWNPVDSELRLDHAAILKVQGDLENFFAYSCQALKFAYKPEHLGQGYRNIGCYFLEKEKFTEAAVCYAISVRYDETDVAYEKLSYLEEECGVDVAGISLEKGSEFAELYGFKDLVDEDVLGLMLTIGQRHYEEEDYPPAIYMFELFYNLTGNKEIKEVLNLMKKIMAAEVEGE